MRGITNREEISNQIPLLVTGKINFIPVYSEKGMIGDIFCNRVEYGEYEVGFTRRNISEENMTDVNWRVIDNLIFPLCDSINKKYYKPFRLEPKEVREFWFSRPKL
jgi:hypothetical protein